VQLPCAGLTTLQAALQAAFPECTDLSEDAARGIASFTPHLSLGQWRDKQALLAAMQVRMCACWAIGGIDVAGRRTPPASGCQVVLTPTV
jgi:hypothetical protein